MTPATPAIVLRGARFAHAGDVWLPALVTACHPKRQPRSLLWLLAHPTLVVQTGTSTTAIGYATMTYTPSLCLLYDLGVAERSRGTGLGRALLAERIRLGLLFGVTAFIGGVEEDNAPMIRMLDEAGFDRRHDAAPAPRVGPEPYVVLHDNATLRAWLDHQYADNPWLKPQEEAS